MNVLPDNWLWKIKVIFPRLCWADLVVWNMRYRPIADILRPEESGMMAGQCRAEVEEYGHGWCGQCVKQEAIK